MKLKICKCCGKQNTTKNAQFIGRKTLGVDCLWFNCLCGGTFVIVIKDKKKAA